MTRLGSFSKFTEVAQIFGLLYSAVKSMYAFIFKKCFGLLFGRFFTSSSGHPDYGTVSAVHRFGKENSGHPSFFLVFGFDPLWSFRRLWSKNI
jgi:hypothetical protein